MNAVSIKFEWVHMERETFSDAIQFDHYTGPIFIAAAGFALLLAGGYWYAISGKDQVEEEKHENTDESESDEDDHVTRHNYD